MPSGLKLYYWKGLSSIIIGWPEYSERLQATSMRAVLEFNEYSFHLTIGNRISNPSHETLIKLAAVMNLAVSLNVESYRRRVFANPADLVITGRIITIEPWEQAHERSR